MLFVASVGFFLVMLLCLKACQMWGKEFTLLLCSQAVNFWQVLVMNDEHTERRYLLYFLLGWGLPALVIIVQVIVLLGGYGWSIRNVYGLVQGDV